MESLQQYFPVILQIDSRIAQAGFAGDDNPLISIQVSDPVTGYKVWGAPDNMEIPLNNTHALSQSESSLLTGKLHHYHKHDVLHKKWLFNYDIILHENIEQHSSITQDCLEKLCFYIYNQALLVDAKRCKVVFPVPISMPVHIKQIISNVLLIKIQAQSLIFLPQPILSVFGAGSTSGLVIDFGWHTIEISVVFDHRLLYKFTRDTTRGSRKSLHYSILEHLLETTNAATNLSYDDMFDFVENIIHQGVYCRPKDSEMANGTDTFSFKGITIPSNIRYLPLESLLFEQSGIDDDNEIDLIGLLLEIITKLPIDLRSPIAERMIFTGILAEVPGLRTRILQELRSKTNLKFKAVVTLGPWAGASLYCSTKLMASSKILKSQELVRDEYLQNNRLLPDWIDQLYQLRLK